ncbi:MAG: hypothetical protein HYY14_02955 [Candidatus Omnitrophica bacterium]|nr:hypothetical protein [Candidatus Omnitrophota bacterium]
MSRAGLLIVSSFILFSVCPGAEATVQNLMTFKKAYPGKDAKAYSCKVCHQGAMGKADDLNVYGLSLKATKPGGAAKILAEADFHLLDQEDADQDGAANLMEWEQGTDLADPASHPEGVTPPAAGGAAGTDTAGTPAQSE